MTDDEEGAVAASSSEHDGELLLYDFFKHLTSLSLLTLGGVLVIIKDLNSADVKPILIVVAIVLISLGGILAFSGSSEIARARYKRAPAGPMVEFCRRAAPSFLAVGVGMFLSIFVDSLN